MLSFEDMLRWRRLAREQEQRSSDQADKEEAKEKGESSERDVMIRQNRSAWSCVHDGGSETRSQVEC